MITRSTLTMAAKGFHPLDCGFKTTEDYLTYRRFNDGRRKWVSKMEEVYKKNAAVFDDHVQENEKRDLACGKAPWTAGRSQSSLKRMRSWVHKTFGEQVPEAPFEVWFGLKYGLSKSPRNGLFMAKFNQRRSSAAAAQPTATVPILATPKPLSPVATNALDEFDELIIEKMMKDKELGFGHRDQARKALKYMDRKIIIKEALVCSCHD